MTLRSIRDGGPPQESGSRALPPCDGCRGRVRYPDGLVAVNSTAAEHWWWGHATCRPPAADTAIAYTRLDGPRKLLAWTLRLGERAWFDLGAWAALVRRLTRVVEI